MGKRASSPQRLDHVDRQSQVGVSGAMRARDVSRPTDDDTDAADEQAPHTDDTEDPSARRQQD